MISVEDLVTWLRAQLAEDERVARWLLSEVYGIYPDGHSDAGLAFMNRFDEARVLAEVGAKRRMLQQFELRGSAVRCIDGVQTGGVWDDMLRLLALPYADRSGYRDEWRP